MGTGLTYSPEELYEKIKVAMAEARARGWTIVKGKTIDYLNNTCCPVAAYVIINKAPDDYLRLCNSSIVLTAKKLLGVTDGQLISLMDGIDGKTVFRVHSEWVALGERIRGLMEEAA